MTKKNKKISKVDNIKVELKALKEKKKKLHQKQKTQKKSNDTKKKEKKKALEAKKKTFQVQKKEKKKALEAKKKALQVQKKEKKKALEAKKKALEAKKKEKQEEKTLEEELEEQLSDKEIENFQIEKVNMEKLTSKVCEILYEKESTGMIQSELWKKLKLTSRDGSRLALKLERLGIISREKILENERWTYRLIIKKTPISTESMEKAPCLTCPVEQKCTIDGEISPRTCQLIEDWVIIDLKKPKLKQ